jgi:hypothetical protein
MVLPGNYVDPWKNPFAPTASLPPSNVAAQFGSIWSNDAVSNAANSSTKPEDSGVHRPLYAASSTNAPVKNDAVVPELSLDNLAINDEKSAEENGDDAEEVAEDDNEETSGRPYQGKRGGRGGRKAGGRLGGRSGRGPGRGRGGRSSSSNEKSSEQVDEKADTKANETDTSGKPLLGQDKRSGRGRGSGRGRKSGKRGPPKDKTSPKNEKPAPTASE